MGGGGDERGATERDGRGGTAAECVEEKAFIARGSGWALLPVERCRWLSVGILTKTGCGRILGVYSHHGNLKLHRRR